MRAVLRQQRRLRAANGPLAMAARGLGCAAAELPAGAAVPAPRELLREMPLPDAARATAEASRRAIGQILAGEDSRLLVVVGPCSIHDVNAAMDYAQRLAPLRTRLAAELEVVMRVYFEKPRTTVGWKGLLNDPSLLGTHDIGGGLRLGRQLLLSLGKMGMPCGVEFLDLNSHHYLADSISWGAIGARTTESQVHREMASALPIPIGFKNSTEGSVQVAVDAIGAASQPHCFLGVQPSTGELGVVESAGNPHCHVVLRGGSGGPNYDAASVAAAAEAVGGDPSRRMVMVRSLSQLEGPSC
eukprot:COSAG04_NODE_409_length_14823_cov_4.646767_10_plen_300_part_00